MPAATWALLKAHGLCVRAAQIRVDEQADRHVVLDAVVSGRTRSPR